MLSEIIIDKIQNEGPISFHDFMEMSLYYPDLGYYTSAQNRIGKEGDYFTSPYLTAIFGEMVALQLQEMWELLSKNPFTVVEYGAGTGMLTYDILKELKNNKELYDQLIYFIIERSPFMREKEKLILSEKVIWVESIHDIPGINGCIFSNELVDNFSVHLVVMDQELMEVFVDFKQGFVEVLKPASEILKEYLKELNVVLPKGYRTEINLQAIEWTKEIALALNKGFVLTVDYGYGSHKIYSPDKKLGTLLCYHKHKINDQPYRNIGEQDITAHVNFSALAKWGIKYGLECTGFTNQNNFMAGLGLVDHLRKKEKNGQDNLNNKEKIFLIHNMFMDLGTKLNVLIQNKGVYENKGEWQNLSGLKFSQSLIC